MILGSAFLGVKTANFDAFLRGKSIFELKSRFACAVKVAYFWVWDWCYHKGRFFAGVFEKSLILGRKGDLRRAGKFVFFGFLIFEGVRGDFCGVFRMNH